MAPASFLNTIPSFCLGVNKVQRLFDMLEMTYDRRDKVQSHRLCYGFFFVKYRKKSSVGMFCPIAASMEMAGLRGRAHRAAGGAVHHRSSSSSRSWGGRKKDLQERLVPDLVMAFRFGN